MGRPPSRTSYIISSLWQIRCVFAALSCCYVACVDCRHPSFINKYMGMENSYYLLASYQDLSVGENIFCTGFVKKGAILQWNNMKHRQRNGCCNLKIFINEKYLHLVTTAIDSEGILHFKRFPGNSSFRGLFSPNTSPCRFISTRIGTLHLNVNAQNGREGLSGRVKGWNGTEPTRGAEMGGGERDCSSLFSLKTLISAFSGCRWLNPFH